MKKVVNSLFGYRDPKPDEDFTDVIYTAKEYNDNIRKISGLEDEIRKWERDYNSSIAHYKKSANDKIAEIKAQADERIAEAQTKMNEYKDRVDSLENIKKNLIRIATERANAQRGLTPKKQHIGYIFLSVDEYVFNCEYTLYRSSKTKIMQIPCFRIRLQSPYKVSFALDSARDMIQDDLLETLCEKIGVDSVYGKGIVGIGEEELREILKREENFIFKTQYKANFQKGFWEVEYLARDMVIIPPDMTVGK